MKLTFHGAAQTVTGSMHELAVNGKRYLLDCGLYQGRRKEARERNANFAFPASAIDAVVLSHAHTDHTGNLPTLAKNGFSGPVYTTPATTDLCHSMLPDSAYIQEKDATFIAKRKGRRRKLGQEDELEAVEPLYNIQDAERALSLFESVLEGTDKEIGPGLRYRPLDAGHMLGSSSLVFDIEQNGTRRRLAYSGDIGRPGLPITRDPDPMPPVDYLIMESTYGDRLHKDIGAVKDKLAEAINRACQRGGRIAALPVYVDSPLAINVTEVFRRHPYLFDEETRRFLDNGSDPFGFKLLRYVREVSESKALNDLRGPFLVLSASGMCEAGRVLHHLRNTIENPKNMVLITGFQAEHTLGRKIVEKWPEVPIFGEPVRLRAEVVKLNELSGHADQQEMLAWLKPMAPTLKRIFLVHGEPAQSAALAKAIQSVYDLPVTIPARGESFLLD